MRRAFTLLESVVVIVVLSILASAAVIGFVQVQEKAHESGAEAQMQALLREVVALGALDDHSPQRNQVGAAVADVPGHHLLAAGSASGQPGWVAAAHNSTQVGVAVVDSQKRCTLGRADRAKVEVWVVGDVGGSCTGEVALLGPGKVESTPLQETELTAPANLLAESVGPGEVLLSWNAVPGAAQYRVSVGVEERFVPDPTSTISGLPEGEELTAQVVALSETGREGPASTVTFQTRPDGPWDARLAWRYDGNTICYGGTSSWTWQMVVSIPEYDGREYRAELEYLNEVDAGTSPWGGTLLQPYLPGYRITPEVQVCAPEGEPTPPFAGAHIVSEESRSVVPLGLTGAELLQGHQIEERQSGQDLEVGLPAR